MMGEVPSNLPVGVVVKLGGGMGNAGVDGMSNLT